MTEPDQWAEALWDHLLNKTFSRSQAIEAIQRAFEERERELREKLARYEQGAGPDDWRQCPGQCGESCCGYHDACRQSLATRQDAPVTENSDDQ